ncbi:MAG: DUF3343 domain-containing protein [Coriobacteriia bacterium]|nr:DUF3343 domain-containing protein [Coriobacteriia bacterium]
MFLFEEVSQALKAEKTLLSEGYDVRLVAPPQHLRAGCDLAVAVESFEQPGARRALEGARVLVRGWADTLEGGLELAALVTTEDFGEWLMVRAGNMKASVEKATGRIVNTSGGGCPDIPYLNLRLVGRTLREAEAPKDLGYTLCALMLDRAVEGCRRELLAEDREAHPAEDGRAAPECSEASA